MVTAQLVAEGADLTAATLASAHVLRTRAIVMPMSGLCLVNPSWRAGNRPDIAVNSAGKTTWT